MIKYLQYITDKILDSSSRMNSIQEFIYNDLIADFANEKDKPRVLGINIRDGVLDIAKLNNIDLKALKVSTSSKHSDEALKNDILSNNIEIEPFDLVIFDSCLQYFKHPDKVLLDSFKFSKVIRVVLKNYGNFKHRLHFLTHGTWDFIDKEAGIFESKVVSPFGIRDFYNLCDKNHIYIKNATYVNKKGLIKGAFSSIVAPNLHLDDAVFDLEKI